MATKVAVQQTTGGQTIGPNTTYNSDGSIASYGTHTSNQPGYAPSSAPAPQNNTTPAASASSTPIDYTFHYGSESIPEYNARIAAARGSSPSGTNTPYVSDSSSVVAGENSTINELNTLFGQTGDIKNLMANSQNAIAEIDAYQRELKNMYDADVNGIKSSYEFARKDTEGAQERERGSMNTVITTKLGGYLGSSGSAVGAMNSLAKEHRTQLLKLDAQRDAALQAARSAMMDKNFQLARLKAEEIKSVSSEIYQRQQDFFNNALKLSSEKRQQDEATRTRIKDTLEMFTMAAGSDQEAYLDPEKEREIDSYYGVAGFTRNYLDAARQSAIAESQQQKFDTMQKYVNLIESVPAGMQIPFGDEVITGIGSAADISTFQVEDAAGNVRVVAYNKRTGDYNMSNMGKIGTPSGGGGASEADKNAAVSATMQALSSGKDSNGNPVMDPTTGEISASAYIQAREAANQKYPGTASAIDAKFLDGSAGERYFDNADLLYLRQKLGVGVGYGAQPAE